jgi:hypothetical protein
VKETPETPIESTFGDATKILLGLNFYFVIKDYFGISTIYLFYLSV